MDSRRFIPRFPLSEFVHCLWYSQGAPQTHSKEKLLPNGECSLIFNLREDAIRTYDARDLSRCNTYGRAILSAARSDCFVIDTSQQERVIGVQFRPGGAFPFFRMPISEFEGTTVALDDLWRGRAGEIRERILEAETVESMFAILEGCLLKVMWPIPRHPAVAHAVEQFRRSGYVDRVAEVRERTGLSSRRFSELFRREVGLTPKMFCRVRRFQRVLNAIHRKREIDWLQVALGCGYYDQAHFIHDFQSFSGLTPSGYVAAATPHLNHVPLT